MTAWMKDLRVHFGPTLQVAEPLSSYTTSRVGGPADALLTVSSAEALAEAARYLWKENIPFTILGNGSNVLIPDEGLHQVVILNRARDIVFREDPEAPSVSVESGVMLGDLARKAAERGLSGLEWAAGIPGTVGGAIYGNAGAHGHEMSQNIILAEILHRDSGKGSLAREDLDFAYRTSLLKKAPGRAVILAATLALVKKTPEEVQECMRDLLDCRRRIQPAGASIGSMFRNPAGESAGRLIDNAGLKGVRSGGVVISEKHANFMVNEVNGTASDYWNLINLVKKTVSEKFNQSLELEVELLGDWQKMEKTG